MRKFKILSTKQLDPLLIEKAKEDDIEIIQRDFIAIERIWSDEKFLEIQQLFKKTIYRIHQCQCRDHS